MTPPMASAGRMISHRLDRILTALEAIVKPLLSTGENHCDPL